MFSWFSQSSLDEDKKQSEESPKDDDESPVFLAISKIDNFPWSINKPPEQIRYENLTKQESKLCEYLSINYKSDIAKCKFWTNDIIPRFVTDTYYIKTYDERLELTINRFEEYLKHHIKYHFDDILILPSLNTCKHLEIIRENKEILSMYYYGIDKYGHPILWDNGDTFTVGDKLKNTFIGNDNDGNYERAKYWRCRMKRMEANLFIKLSKYYGCNISKAVAVLDLKKGSVSDFYTNRAFYQWNLRTSSELFPETIHKIFIINAPWAFQMIWKICCSFLDEITVQKTIILGTDYIKELIKYIDINMIPKEFGGHGIWEPRSGDVPINFPFQMNDELKKKEENIIIKNKDALECKQESETDINKKEEDGIKQKLDQNTIITEEK